MDTTAMAKQISVSVRWCMRRDLADMVRIEQQCFEFPWDESEFRVHLKNRNTIGMVAERGDRVVGFMMYQLDGSTIKLINLAVDPAYQRRGIGVQMIEKLLNRLAKPPRKFYRLEAVINEYNVTGQLFLRACGLRWYKTFHELFELEDGTYRDGYCMRFPQ